MKVFPIRYMMGLLGALMLLAACSWSSNGKTTTANDRTQALQYAQCMRDNGVPDFPDPDSEGRFRGIGHERQGDPAFAAAAQKCRDLAPGGEHQKFGDAAFVAQALQYAKCMRDNGVPDFPDPDSEGRFRGIGHERQGDPTFAAAAQKCRDKLPGGGHPR